MILPPLALALALALAQALPVISLCQKFVKCQKFNCQRNCQKFAMALLLNYKALLGTPQEGGPKVTEGAPYFRYIVAWEPHIYRKIRAGGPHLRWPPIFYDTVTYSAG